MSIIYTFYSIILELPIIKSAPTTVVELRR